MALTKDFDLHRGLHLDSLQTLAGGLPDGLNGQLEELREPLAAFETAATQIGADPHLTGAGKRQKLAEARETATRTIDTWTTSRLTGIDAQIATTEATRRTATPDAASTPGEFTVTSMAQKLATFDPLEVAVLYSDAPEPVRRTMETAVETLGPVPRKRPDGALVWDHLLPPERIAQARTARLDAAQPAVATQLADLQRIRATYRALASTAASLVGK